MTNVKNTICAVILFGLLLFPARILALTEAHIAFYNSGQANTPISNEYFIDTNSMTVQEIQDFLVANNSYLKGFVDNSDAGRGRSAAQIIWDAAHGKYEAGNTGGTPFNGILINEATGTVNPKVILVYLQKEQSLISRPTYQEWAMLASLGYFCFAGASGDNNDNNCNDAYEGFTKQVENGAWQLRYNYERSSGTGFSDYQVGQVFNTSDGYNITLTNRATASVYRYTPYVYYSAYNVWNLFYNTYNFDQGGGVAAPQDPPTENDTAAVSGKSYRDSYTFNGIKMPNCRVFLGDQVIAELQSYTWTVSFSPNVGTNIYDLVYKDSDGVELNRKAYSITRNKLADINSDGTVDISDLSILANFWGGSNPSEPMADINSDGAVDIIDLSTLASNWNG